MNRPDWDEYFAELTVTVSKRSTCIRRQVGAIIVRDNQILSTGYNGAPSGIPHCTEETCIRSQMKIPSGERTELCMGAHAETNAIAQAAKNGVSINNAKIYISAMPCSSCLKSIINSGIKEIVVIVGEGLLPYYDDLSQKMISLSGIKTRVYKYEPTCRY